LQLLGAAPLAALAADDQPRRAGKLRAPRVAIVGAGLSGLYCALLLEQEGVEVTLLEGRDRTGGRVYTLHDIPGRPEAGGEVFGPRYARCLDVLKSLGVAQRAPRPRTQADDAELVMNVRGQTIRLEQWATHPLNPHPAALKALTPWRLFFEYLPRQMGFQDLAEWMDPRHAALDVSYASHLRTLGFDDETIRLQQANSAYGNTLHEVSTLHLLHYFTWARLNATGAGRTQCAGGNQQLPDGMRGRLRGDVLLRSVVSTLEDRVTGVRLRTRDGRTFDADRVVVTVPFSLARFLDFDPPLRGVQWEAVETLPYYATFQIHYEFRGRFWENDGLPPSLWTDGPVGRVNLLRDEAGAPACLLVYVNGVQAQYLDRLAPAEADAFVQSELARLRPSTRGQLRAIRIHSNQNDPFFGGSYAYWKPGMPLRFPGAMAQPHGRIHFAGEHTATLHRGMEGAMESGERAALEVLAAL
jgi:monoamine oxidase